MSKISHILLLNTVVVPIGTKLRETALLMKQKKVASVFIDTGSMQKAGSEKTNNNENDRKGI